MGFHFADDVTQLSKRVVAGFQAEGGQDRLVNLRRAPAADARPDVEEHFHQAEDACVLDLDARHERAAGRDQQSQALKQGEIDMDVQRFGLEGGESVRNASQFLTDRCP